MSTDRDTTRIVRSWLRTDENESADRILGTVLDRLDTTPQRRATRWPARRLPEMNSMARLALAAAAIVVVAWLGINFLVPGGPRIGGPDTSVAPEPSFALDPTPTALGADDPLEPGTYVSHPLASNPSLAVTFTAPEGWQAYDGRTLVPLGDDSTRGPDGAAFAFGEFSDIYSDPCQSLGEPDVDGGTTAEDFAAAFSAQSAYEVSVADVSVAGYSGKQVELQLPSSFDASCPREEYFVVGGGIYPQGDGNRWQFTILDVEGSRLVIFSHDFPDTPASIRADIQSMLDSIEIEIELAD